MVPILIEFEYFKLRHWDKKSQPDETFEIEHDNSALISNR